MANYYYGSIKSNKLTQEAAIEIFDVMATNRIRSFVFYEGGKIDFNTRGYPEKLDEKLESLGITDNEIEVEDEFERVYRFLPPE